MVPNNVFSVSELFRQKIVAMTKIVTIPRYWLLTIFENGIHFSKSSSSVGSVFTAAALSLLSAMLTAVWATIGKSLLAIVVVVVYHLLSGDTPRTISVHSLTVLFVADRTLWQMGHGIFLGLYTRAGREVEFSSPALLFLHVFSWFNLVFLKLKVLPHQLHSKRFLAVSCMFVV